MQNANAGSPENLLVLHLESPNRGGQGDSVYRVVQPCRMLAQRPGVRVVTGSFLSPVVHELLPLADVLVLADVVEADLLPIMRRRAEQGLATIYEVNDDFQALQPWNPTAYLSQNAVTRSLSSQLARRAHGVQFSTEHLAQVFAHLNPHAAVLPNALWAMPAPTQKGEGVRVGWGGSLGHKEDFATLVPVMGRVLERFGEVTFDVMGAPVFRGLCAPLPAGRWTYRAGGSLADYYRFLEPLHVGLCPLQDTDFNRGRSDVKFLEYAGHGAATLAADLPPYRGSVLHGETGFLFRRVEEIEGLLSELVGAPEKRMRVAEAARAYVREHRLESVQAEARWTFVKSTLVRARAGVGGRGPQNDAQMRRLLRGLPRLFPGEALMAAPHDKLERCLLEGLTATRDGDTLQAVASFRTATARAPQFYLPWLYLGSVEPDPRHALAALDKAAKLGPISVAVALLQADRWSHLGERTHQRQSLLRAHALAPEMGVPAAQLSDLDTAEGDMQGALEREAVASHENPFYAIPHVKRALASLEQGIPVSPAPALLRCLDHDPRFWMTRFALGRTDLARGRPQEALEHLQIALRYAPDPAPVLAQLARVAVAFGDLEQARQYLEAAKRPYGH